MVQDNRIHPLDDYLDLINGEVLKQITDIKNAGFSVRVFHSDFGDVDFVIERGDQGFQWPINEEFNEEFDRAITLLKSSC